MPVVLEVVVARGAELVAGAFAGCCGGDGGGRGGSGGGSRDGSGCSCCSGLSLQHLQAAVKI